MTAEQFGRVSRALLHGGASSFCSLKVLMVILWLVNKQIPHLQQSDRQLYALLLSVPTTSINWAKYPCFALTMSLGGSCPAFWGNTSVCARGLLVLSDFS